MGSTYVWLKAEAEAKLAALKEQGLWGDVRLDISRKTGQKYISLYESLSDPTAEIPNIPQELIERVTIKESIHTGFRTNGVYRCEEAKGAELVAKTEVRVHSEMNANSIERETYQNISVSGPSFEAVKSIYSMFRQGRLLPDENWEAPQVMLLRQTPAEPAAAES